MPAALGDGGHLPTVLFSVTEVSTVVQVVAVAGIVPRGSVLLGVPGLANRGVPANGTTCRRASHGRL